jgi:hypothetical protein
MANIRDLKKDIDYLFFELFSDCFTYASLHNGEKRGQVQSLIEEAIESRNEFIQKVNSPAGKDNPKLVKQYYSAIRKELFEKIDDYFTKLSDLSKAS